MSLDVLRGVAVLLMVGDHLALMFGGVEADAYRLTAGRLAMPLFFLLAGHLVTRLSVRHVYIVMAGALLPAMVPWLDSPNVLVLYVVGAACIVVARERGVALWAVPALGLALAANGYVVGSGAGFYDPVSLWGLMFVGAMIPRRSLELHAVSRVQLMGRPWEVRAVVLLARIGSAPLRWYVGHVLVLEALRLAGWGTWQ